MQRVESPSPPSSSIIKALFQVHRAVSDFLLMKDLFSLFFKIQKMFVEIYLNPIKKRLFIKTELAHQILVMELDYIKENTKNLFKDKLNLDFKPIDSICREIESEKFVCQMP